MASLLAKIRSSTAASPSTGSTTPKKDPNAPPLTPLEKHLLDAGPIRDDGSDKFFGMENVSIQTAQTQRQETHADEKLRGYVVRKYLVTSIMTLLCSSLQPLTHSANSYCNSILQSLYYSAPFRDQVLSYPKRSSPESVVSAPNGLPRVHIHPSASSSTQSPASPTKPKAPVGTTGRNLGTAAAGQKPEDKDSSDYKKKQVIARGPVLYMNYDNAPSYGMEESLFSSLKDIFEALIAHKSRTGVVSPAKFLEVLKRENEMFRSAMHQDAHEFLNLLLNEVVENVEANAKKSEAEKRMNGSAEPRSFEQALATAMPRSKGTQTIPNTRWVHELFEGTLTSETKCLTCENVSQRDETFLDLSVDLDQHSSVTSCLRKFSEEEMLCERNKFHCDRCGGLQEAEKRMKIKRSPRILALHLKRFKYTEDLQRLQKLFHRVVYPYHLRLFNTTDDAEDPDRLYELYAVVVHIGGGPYHGHYVSIIKTEDRGWLLFDDELVEPVDKSYVLNFFGDRPGLACAYVLFYQETTIEKVRREQEAEGQPTAPTAEAESEPQGLGLKTNGIFTNGIHHVRSAMSPTELSPNGLEHLDKSATEPPSIPLAPPDADGDTTALPPVRSFFPASMNSNSSDGPAKKERKAAEKEKEKAEKAEKARLKEAELRRKESEKKLGAIGDSSDAVGKENNPSALSRFRQGSKSISKKPKFWTSKENKDKSDGGTGEGEDTTLMNDKPERSKNRFSSLRKKTSSMILL
ncbi:MAG: hypothetical protein L6R38_002669 [Xanthoria sp. 2 TBL-2021]|nr:MAG: hypothetical protein L6R38_002669 [Xanthoria sp. 2 TBL-2021]